VPIVRDPLWREPIVREPLWREPIVRDPLKYFKFHVEQVQKVKSRTSRSTNIGDTCCKSGRRRKSVLLPRPLTPHGKLSRWQTQGVCQPHQTHHALWLTDWPHSPRQFPFSTTDTIHCGSSSRLRPVYQTVSIRSLVPVALSMRTQTPPRHTSQF
jgi:hypothetical protein